VFSNDGLAYEGRGRLEGIDRTGCRTGQAREPFETADNEIILLTSQHLQNVKLRSWILPNWPPLVCKIEIYILF
jgi:hypothetical protein